MNVGRITVMKAVEYIMGREGKKGEGMLVVVIVVERVLRGRKERMKEVNVALIVMMMMIRSVAGNGKKGQ